MNVIIIISSLFLYLVSAGAFLTFLTEGGITNLMGFLFILSIATLMLYDRRKRMGVYERGFGKFNYVMLASLGKRYEVLQKEQKLILFDEFSRYFINIPNAKNLAKVMFHIDKYIETFENYNEGKIEKELYEGELLRKKLDGRLNNEL